RRGVRVSAAGVPDPVHAQAVDREESDLSGLGGLHHVVHQQTRALRDADAIRILLVVREQEAVAELHLVGVRSLWHGDLSEDSRSARMDEVDDAGPDAEVAHVTDVEHVAVPPDRHAMAGASEVGMAAELASVLFPRGAQSGPT